MKTTITPREFETRMCESCGDDYEAPIKINGEGVIGGGKCPNCIRADRPPKTESCPVCGKPFKVQAGHQRQTCSRECQKIQTALNRAEVTKRSAAEAAEEARQRKAEKMKQVKATQAAKPAPNPDTPTGAGKRGRKRQNISDTERRVARAIANPKATGLSRAATAADVISKKRVSEIMEAASQDGAVSDNPTVRALQYLNDMWKARSEEKPPKTLTEQIIRTTLQEGYNEQAFDQLIAAA